MQVSYVIHLNYCSNSIAWICHCSCVHFTSEGHLDCLQYFTDTHNAAMNEPASPQVWLALPSKWHILNLTTSSYPTGTPVQVIIFSSRGSYVSPASTSVPLQFIYSLHRSWGQIGSFLHQNPSHPTWDTISNSSHGQEDPMSSGPFPFLPLAL